MNHNYEKQLEAAIDRELRELGELPAPARLTSRIMGAIEQRSAQPWYRGAWQTWPAPMQAVSLMAFVVVFGGISYGVVELFQTASATSSAHQVVGWLSGSAALFKSIGVLGEALVLATRHFGMTILIGCVAGIVLAYAACFGLGTAWVRLAMVRRQ